MMAMDNTSSKNFQRDSSLDAPRTSNVCGPNISASSNSSLAGSSTAVDVPQSSSTTAFRGGINKVSQRWSLTAASSSGSDPLASPSNEAISELSDSVALPDHPTYTGVLSSGSSGVQHSRGMGSSSIGAGVCAGAATTGPGGACGLQGGIQAQLHSLERQYQMQKELLNRQFEEQRWMLEREQQAQMHDYIKRMMIQRKQEELYEMQQRRMAEEEQRMNERWELLKHKRKEEESAVASAAVKLKLREVLLNKSHRDPQGSGKSSPEFRQWSATQHSSLEQHSPPTTTDWSPPLHLQTKFEGEYPLRKTVSEPSLKMRSSKLSLRQKVIQRNTVLTRRREMYRKRVPLTDHDDSPGSPPTVVSSQGSSVDMGVLEEEPRASDTDMIAQSVSCTNNYSNPDILAAARRHRGGKPSPPGMSISHASDLEMKRIRMNNCDRTGFGPTSSSAGTVPQHIERSPYLVHPMSGMSGVGSTGVITCQSQLESSNMTEAYVQALIMARSSLPRTRSEPIPLPVQLLLQQHQLLLVKQQEQLLREGNKMYLKQKSFLSTAPTKLMENVDEAAETKLVQEISRGDSADSVDVVVVDDFGGGGTSTLGEACGRDDNMYTMSQGIAPWQPVHPQSLRKAFLPKVRAQTLSGAFPMPLSTNAAGSESGEMTDKPSLERGNSCPVAIPARPVSPEHPLMRYSKTGIVYDPTMLKHTCICQGMSAGGNEIHPEHPNRLVYIWARLEDTGLVDRCTLVKSRRAKREELQTCHSEAYVQMYGSSQRRTDPAVCERFMSRFCRLPCGGIGVDSDTVWNEQHTTMAARVAAGSVIELSFKVAVGDIDNGFALVRPPGHHAEDTQAMGFCFFNSIGIATKLLLERLKMKRILIVDWDVHHGNSTQQLFYADPRVLYISLHRHDDGNFFPGTGYPAECGIERGLGFNVNIAWSGAFMGDAEYLAAFRTIVMPISRDYHPELVLVSAGFDAAIGHPVPLGGYNVSPHCFGHMTQQLMTLTDRRIVLVLEGGYELSPLVDSTELCIRALLDDKIGPPSNVELSRSPCKEAIETLANTINHQVSYWPCLARYAQTIDWSYSESQRCMKDEADTVSAFAGLSVVSAGSYGSLHGSQGAAYSTDMRESMEH